MIQIRFKGEVVFQLERLEPFNLDNVDVLLYEVEDKRKILKDVK
jgi:hypothetical protein